MYPHELWWAYVTMVLRPDTYPSSSLSPSLSTGISAFLEWVRIWYYAWVERDVVYEYYEDIYEDTPNRFQRRIGSKTLPSHRSDSSFHALLPRGLTLGQFTERAARLSILGRRRFYFILNWLKHLSRYLQILICGKVKRYTPFAGLSSESGGIWDAHLWPN